MSKTEVALKKIIAAIITALQIKVLLSTRHLNVALKRWKQAFNNCYRNFCLFARVSG